MAYKVQISIQDADGENSTTSLFFSDALTVAQLTTEVQTVVEALDALIDGVVTGVSVALGIDVTGWTLKGAIAGQHDRLEGGRFVFQSAGGFKSTATLPTFDRATYVPAGSENVDQSDVDVTAFTDAVLAATTVTNQGDALNAVAAAYEVFGGRR